MLSVPFALSLSRRRFAARWKQYNTFCGLPACSGSTCAHGSVAPAVWRCFDFSSSHLGDDLLRACGHQARIRTDGHELKALLDPLQRGLRRAVVNSGDQAMFPGPRQDVIDGLDDGRVDVVERRRAAERQ